MAKQADGEGFERDSLNTLNDNSLQQSKKQSEAESEADWPDSDLKAVVDAWPILPDAIKAGILAMIRVSVPNIP